MLIISIKNEFQTNRRLVVFKVTSLFSVLKSLLLLELHMKQGEPYELVKSFELKVCTKKRSSKTRDENGAADF